MANNKRKDTGITLIALIITIIVLLILAGITIGMLTTNNSILTQAGKAKTETKESEEAEKLNLAIMDAATNASTTVTGELTTEIVKNAIKGQFGDGSEENVSGDGPWKYKGEYKTYQIDKTGNTGEANSTTAKDSNDVPYELPRGAKFVEGTVDTGLVIEYKGSGFVWIPVDKETLYAKGTTKAMATLYTLNSEIIDSNGRRKYEGMLYNNDLNARASNEDFCEPRAVSGDTSEEITWELLQEEYDAMIESVMEHGGFYVGRYESSLNESKIKSVAGVRPISALPEEADRWYGLYKKQKEFTNDQDSVVASMIWGSQYDAMLNWAKEGESGDHVTSSEYGNHTGTLKNTGETTTDVINNIYDLEGNLYEWTLEAHKDRTYQSPNYTWRIL